MSVARVLSPLRLGSLDKSNNQMCTSKVMSEGLATPLRSVLTCSGCSVRYDDALHRPKFLQCFHTACLVCVSKGFKSGKVACPSCNKVTEATSATELPDNTQLCTILNNMSSLALNEVAQPSRDTCDRHAARINFWCETCRLPACRDCTVLAHRESAGHKVRDHDQAIEVLGGEIRRAIADVRIIHQETRRLRHDQRQYVLRQLEACRALEKQLKQDLKNLDAEKKEDRPNSIQWRGVERLEEEAKNTTSLVALHDAAIKAAKLRTQAAEDFAAAKSVIADNLLRMGKLNRSTDDLDSLDCKSSGSGSPGSPSHAASDRKVRSLAGYCANKLLHNGRASGRVVSRAFLSLEAPTPTIQLLPRVFFDLAIEGIQQTGRVVIELRTDKAPQLCENFIRLCTGDRGYGYRGSQIFRCLPGWWCQGGDFESNDGEGGKAALEEDLIPAEPTELEPKPGAVEMLCMSTNEKGALMVASQFFIHVKKYSYTHVFGYVVEGLDIVEKLTQLGDPDRVYRPSKTIVIANCGKMN